MESRGKDLLQWTTRDRTVSMIRYRPTGAPDRPGPQPPTITMAKVAKAVEETHKRKVPAGDSLYAGLMAPDPENDKIAAQRAKELDLFGDPPAKEDPCSIIFLDIDGVLLPLDKGGLPTITLDGEVLPIRSKKPFVPEALTALKYIVHKTGARLVLSSEWRRSKELREEVEMALRAVGTSQLHDFTDVFEAREEVVVGTPSAPDGHGTMILRWAERRAREISSWLREHPEVKRWVALDDLDLRFADDVKVKLPETYRMAAGLVLTDAEVGLTMSNARIATSQLLKGMSSAKS
eukprot:gnl/TRDRNA2_/TRDRNA2_146080_c0_seq7.p2 gnl/TRDRNA2_/TRDRNA2_146080_c0~~gnl/TRDRNA2_/TRDRNA2_146080_c0_seq7.p2  ORF type:complete len:292 (+),score=53.60 gnl/TRDRNA2_/TRDRNA2_146080_c0_seq7:586-1461(+)